MLVGRAGIENGLGIREPVALNTPEFFTLNLKVAYDIPVYKSITLQVNAGVQNLTNAYQDDFDKINVIYLSATCVHVLQI